MSHASVISDSANSRKYGSAASITGPIIQPPEPEDVSHDGDDEKGCSEESQPDDVAGHARELVAAEDLTLRGRSELSG